MFCTSFAHSLFFFFVRSLKCLDILIHLPKKRPQFTSEHFPKSFIVKINSDIRKLHPFQSEGESDDFPRIPTPENPLTLQGHVGIEEGRLYNGPPFPPQHPPLPSNTGGGVLEADARREEALQERAMDW